MNATFLHSFCTLLAYSMLHPRWSQCRSHVDICHHGTAINCCHSGSTSHICKHHTRFLGAADT